MELSTGQEFETKGVIHSLSTAYPQSRSSEMKNLIVRLRKLFAKKQRWTMLPETKEYRAKFVIKQ